MSTKRELNVIRLAEGLRIKDVRDEAKRADVIISWEGMVVKDRDAVFGRQATKDELMEARLIEAPKFTRFVVIAFVVTEFDVEPMPGAYAVVYARTREEVKRVLVEELKAMGRESWASPDSWVINPVTPVANKPIAIVVEAARD